MQALRVAAVRATLHCDVGCGADGGRGAGPDGAPEPGCSAELLPNRGAPAATTRPLVGPAGPEGVEVRELAGFGLVGAGGAVIVVVGGIGLTMIGVGPATLGPPL